MAFQKGMTMPQECKQCGTSKTPMWRSGPLGPKTLCNACGVRAQRAHQRTRTASAGNKGAPLPAGQKNDALHPMLHRPDRAPPRQPAKPLSQPARQLSQRISRRQCSKALSEEEAEISSDDDDLEAELRAKSHRAAKRKHADAWEGGSDCARRPAQGSWLLDPAHTGGEPGGGSEGRTAAHPSPGSQVSGQSSLDQGRRVMSSCVGGPLPGSLPADSSPAQAQRPTSRNSHIWAAAANGPNGTAKANGQLRPGCATKLASIHGHLVTRTKAGVQKFPNVQLLVRVAALGAGQTGAGQRGSGRHQLLVLSCIVQDGCEAAVCAIPRQGLSVAVSMPTANPNAQGYRWESPQGWIVILPDRQSALQLAGILKNWLGAPTEAARNSSSEMNGAHAAASHPAFLQQRPFGRQCEWDCRADQAACQWWRDLFRNNPERFSHGQELPVSILERLFDTLELASASLRLRQGIPEAAARAILGNCSWAPAGAVCKVVFTYWQDRRQGQALQGLNTDAVWQRSWPSLWQPAHPLAPLSAVLIPLLGPAARQPAEWTLFSRLSTEGSQGLLPSRPSSDRGLAGCEPEASPGMRSLQLPHPGRPLPAGPDFHKAMSAPCGFLSTFVPQDRPQSATSLDLDFADALCHRDSSRNSLHGGATRSLPASPLLIQPPLLREAPQQHRVVSQESASASPDTSDSHQHSVSTLSTALSAPLFTEPIRTDPTMSVPDELDNLGNFELAGSELMADVEAASLDLFSLAPAK